MKKQHVYLGLGLVAVAGLGIYLYRNRKKGEKTTGADSSCGCEGKSSYVGMPTGGLTGASAGVGVQLQGVGVPNPSPVLAGIPPVGGGAPPVPPAPDMPPVPPVNPNPINPNPNWGNWGWGGYGLGYPVYIDSGINYPQCVIKNANGITKIVPCANIMDVAGEAGLSYPRSANNFNGYYSNAVGKKVKNVMPLGYKEVWGTACPAGYDKVGSGKSSTGQPYSICKEQPIVLGDE